MHCVYRVTFNKRIERNEPPFHYIGSLANYRYENGLLYNKQNRIYYGSSRYKNYKDICKSDEPIIEILYSSDDYRHVVGKERELQIFENAIKSELYFNLRIANEVGNYHALGYAIYRHRENGMTMKLRTDDDLVLNGNNIILIQIEIV